LGVSAPIRLAALLAALVLACEPAVSPRPDTLRIVSLSPSLTRIVLALGSGESLVGVDRYSQRLDGARDKTSLGGLFTPDFERAVELAPNLILAVDSAQQQGFLDQARARGVRVETFRGHTLDDVLESFRRIGNLLARPEAGARLAADVEQELAGLAAERRDAATSVAVIIERDPLYVVGGGSFVDDLIQAAGGRNAFGDLERPYPRVSLEALAERAPDVLLDTTFDEERMDGAPAEARAHWQRYSWVKRVEVLPQGILTLPGPDLPDAARLLRERIRP
jgi:ABC-type Fe3+-hydroxamate transport system substrate-binding protein